MSWPRWWTPSHTRRAFLGGGAALIGLPYLESLLPRAARAATPAPPTRLVFWFAPCGMMMPDWTPLRVGEGYDLPRILQPLAPVQGQVSVLTGHSNRAAMVPVPGDHARGTGSFLTCATVEHTADSDQIYNGVSVDQVAAQAVGADTLFPSLELGTSGGSPVGDCDSGYSCAYTRNISWSDAQTPRAKLVDPRLVFDRLFAGFDHDLTPEQLARQLRWRGSVLDTVTSEANDLHRLLSRSDQAKLDQFLTGVRELELRLDQGGTGECVPGAAPERDLDYAAVVDAMNELTVKALECDLTRFVTFMLENGGSNRTFEFLGVTGAHHELSHHQGVPQSTESLVTIGTWEVARFADLVARLAAIPEQDGTTMLDNTLLLFSSEIADGDMHNHDDLPVLLAGGGRGWHRPGRHLDFGAEVPIADLYLTMLASVGVTPGTFGLDGTRILDLR